MGQSSDPSKVIKGKPMSSSNPMTRKRQKKHRRERARAAKQKAGERWCETTSPRRSPYAEDRFFGKSCAARYDTEEKAIHACIVASASRGVELGWYRCGRCGGWHITSHPFRDGYHASR